MEHRSGMYTDNDGRTWRGFARHHPSGEVYIIEQDNLPGFEANYTAITGPLHHSEVTIEALEFGVDAGNSWPDDVEWATEQAWVPVDSVG